MKSPKPEHWALLSPLLDELLDLPEPDRLARLGEVRRDNPQLGDELAVLLADNQSAQAEGFLAKPLANPGDDATETPETSLAGQRVGPYVLEAPIGQGGGGSVWRARREDGRFTGAVAIKLLHLSLLGRAGADRFKREGDILARLTHPNIAHLLDAGVTSGGQPYLVIELVEGERIDHHCDLNRLTVDARLALFDDVLSAVAHAHTHLVIHRDIKPGNILVTADGIVKLLDFGIAKLLDDETTAGEATELTRDGGRVLTPEYAAPEQLRGEPVTTATDVYALGVLLYQLLGGRHPTSPASGTSAEVVRATLETDAQLVSRALTQDLPGTLTSGDIAASRNTSATGLRHILQGDLDNITAHALRKLPHERYGTVAAFAEDLRRYQAHEPVRAVADTVGYRATKFVRRHRGSVAAGALTVIAIVGGLVGTVWQAQRAEQQAARADRERQEALKQLDLAEAMIELMTVSLGPVSNKPLSVADVLNRGENMVDKQFHDAPDIRAFLKMRLADMWSHGTEIKRMEALLLDARSAAQSIGDTATVTSADCKLSRLSTDRGDFDGARRQLNESIARLGKHHPDLWEPIVVCLKRRAQTNREQGLNEAALADIDQAISLFATPRRGQTRALLDLRATKAFILGSMGRLGPAVLAYDAVLDDLKKRGTFETTSEATTLNNFAVVLLQAGQILRARTTLEQAMKLGQGPGAARTTSWAQKSNYALALTLQGKTDLSVPIAEEALTQAIESGEARAMGYRAHQAAEAQCAAGNLPRCADHVALSAKHLTAILTPNNPALGRVALMRAKVSLLQGNSAAGREHIAQGLKVFDASKQAESWRVQGLILLAQADVQERDFEAALKNAQRAVALSREIFKDFPNSHRGGLAHLMLGQIHLARDDRVRAKEALTQAQTQLDAALGPESTAANETRALLAEL